MLSSGVTGNEYLSKVQCFVKTTLPNIDSFLERPRYVSRYAWAIPNENALRALLKLEPLVEIGAGTGYWAHLLQQRGAAVRPYDQYPPNIHLNRYHPDSHVWTRVFVGGPEKTAKYPDRTLLLCWPPHAGTVAERALKHYKGGVVAYIGEWMGCTANGAFHDHLEAGWTRTLHIPIPNWPGNRDNLTIWKRNPKAPKKRKCV